MKTTYNPEEIEKRWYQKWESDDQFKPSGQGIPYSIMLPPPNITGRLHMGHAFQDTIMDALIRYHRMQGNNTLWQAGTDHAGIATQMVVERQLNDQGKTRHDIGREQFINKIWHWRQESGNNITSQLRRIGVSIDWERERFTMDSGLSKAVNHVFIKLYEQGLIYRGKRLVNWDPVLRTAISDLEVLSEEESGHLWHFRYPLTDGSSYLTVATTRPETMLGDTAVAVHPDDKRYQHLIGKTITLPLVKRDIPIIADNHVDHEFGTGCVKITPAHDFNDADMGKRHHLEQINIFTLDGAINDNAPKKYRGLDRYQARKVIISDLDDLGLLDKIEAHSLMVPRGDRSGAVIEPLLTDQWYVKASVLAKPAVDAVKQGNIKFVPANWDKTFYNWMNDIQDWCISRQIWWGHRIPAWYDEAGNIYVGDSESDVRNKYNLKDITLNQDEDVLDTWFSSALWPFSTLGWPQHTKELSTWYPTSVLVTGFDIIFFWVARMIMMGIKFIGDVPFKEVYVHGLVRDSHGQKMSKSKGNVLDPIDIIDGIDLESLVEKRTSNMMQTQLAVDIANITRQEFPTGIAAHGSDAMRFTFCALASTGRDINFDMNRVTGYRNFCNKLWHAARYVILNTQDEDNGTGDDIVLSLADKWIISQLHITQKKVITAIDNYRFDHVAQSIYDFIWHYYCDWYLELCKPVLTNHATPIEAKRGTRNTLLQVLESTLRLTHPIMPFITEEIWQKVAPLAGKSGSTIMTQRYPVPDDNKIDVKTIKEMEWVMAFINGIRSIRSQMNIPPKKTLPLLLKNSSALDQTRLNANHDFLIELANLNTIELLKGDAPPSSTALVGEMELLIPLAGVIDKEVEIKRLDKIIKKTEQAITQSLGKLNNQHYLEKAPEHVVQKERDKLATMQKTLDQLKKQRQALVVC